MSGVAISVSGLRKRYGNVEVVRGIDLEVREGEVFGFLGPNGAGKTTTVEILEGYRSRDGGEVSVLGVDPAQPTRRWRERIGLVLQECELDPLLTVSETLKLFSSFYRSPRPVEEVIGRVGLAGRERLRLGTLSGGQRRRADVAVALIGDPDLIFLDEPTTGFDPTARREAWQTIEALQEIGKTVLLTTHYMEEAQHLADRVAIIRAGQIVAQGKPDEIGGARASTTLISFLAPDGVELATIGAEACARVDRDGRRVAIESEDAQQTLLRLTGWAQRDGVALAEIEVKRPTLEDAFLDLTASGVDEGAPAVDRATPRSDPRSGDE